MKKPYLYILPAVFMVLSLPASADPWKDESGQGKGRGHERREYKEEYWDGNCKVERKFEKSGEYKEERKCKGGGPVYYERPTVQVVPAAIVVEPGITVHGTVRIGQ